MPGSIHAVHFFNEPEPEGFWPFEERDEDEDEWAEPDYSGISLNPPSSWYKEQQEEEARRRFNRKVFDLQCKWDAFPLRGHPLKHDDFPTDDDIPF